MKWYKRFCLQALIDYSLLPGKLTLKEWLFSPFFKLVFPGQEVTSLKQVPEDYTREGLIQGADKLYSRYFWLAAGIRALGLDIGFGVFYLANPKE